MSPRKNKSVRFSDDELSGLTEIGKRTELEESVLIQKAVRAFIRLYRRHGAKILDVEHEEPAKEGHNAGTKPERPQGSGPGDSVSVPAGSVASAGKTTRRALAKTGT